MTPNEQSKQLHIATWNVNGIRAREAQFLDWVQRDRPDVICLQEIKALPAQLSEPLRDLPGYRCYWHGGGGYSGVGLHIRADTFPEEPHFSHPPFDHETRIVQAIIGHLAIASVYIPNGGKDFAAKLAFMQAMEAYAAETSAAGYELVICGDLNVARTDRDVHPRERKPNAIGQRPEERALFERIIGRGLVDLGRALDPDNERLFTWWPPWREMRQRNIGWRIDYVLASESLAKRAQGCVVLPDVGTSDHAPVVATFDAALLL
jgi:exodeoxyribonuclease-3